MPTLVIYILFIIVILMFMLYSKGLGGQGKMIFRLIVLMFFLQLVLSATKFCSMYCGTGCSDDGSDKCNNKCNSNWVATGNTCKPNDALGWYIHGTTADVTASGGVTVDVYSVSGNAVGVGTCGSFKFMGPMTVLYSAYFSTKIMVPYFEMQIHIGILSIDTYCNDNCPNGNDYQ